MATKCHSKMVTNVYVHLYLVMHIGYVPLQVSFEITAVATVGAFEILDLDNHSNDFFPRYLIFLLVSPQA